MEEVVANLKDTDFIVIKGHVIVAYNRGLIEFRSKDLGCCFTPEEKAVQRITELIEVRRKTAMFGLSAGTRSIKAERSFIK